MKKLSIFAIATLAAVGLSSCLKDKVTTANPNSEGSHKLTIRLANGDNDTRAIEDPATAGDVATVSSGMIYIFKANGDYFTEEALNPTIMGAGQTLDNEVPDNAKVYIVANAPAMTTPPATLADLQNYPVAISTQQGLFPSTALVNEGGTAVTIVETAQPVGATPGTATAAVKLSPAVARLELAEVTDTAMTLPLPSNTPGTPDAMVKITGVFLYNYYESYTMGASYAGQILNFDAAFPTNTLGDVMATPVTGVITTPANVARFTAGASKYWAYQVAAGNTPLLSIQLTKGTTIKYLNVSGYGATFTGFVAGKVYRINSIPFNSLNFANLPDAPGTDGKFTLEVTVTVNPWEIITINPEV